MRLQTQSTPLNHEHHGTFGRLLMDGRPYISPGQVRLIRSCGHRWRTLYLEGTPRYDAAFFRIGNAVHSALEQALNLELTEGTPASTDNVKDTARELALKALYGLRDANEAPGAEYDATNAVKDADVAAAMAGDLHEWWLQSGLKVESVEGAVTAGREWDGVEYVLHGYFDALVVDAQGRRWVLDWKTAARAPSRDANDEYVMERSHQHALLCYVDGIDVDVYGIRTVTATKTKATGVYVADAVVSSGLLAWARDVTDSAVEQILRRDHAPNPFGAGFQCSKRMCEAWMMCPGGGLLTEQGPD